jgi:hypothetical protein
MNCRLGTATSSGSDRRQNRMPTYIFNNFLLKSVAKGKVSLTLASDGRNLGAGREKMGHFIPPRLAQRNDS